MNRRTGINYAAGGPVRHCAASRTHHERHLPHRPGHRRGLHRLHPPPRRRQAAVPPARRRRAGRRRARGADHRLRQRLRTPSGATPGPPGLRGVRRVSVSGGGRGPQAGPGGLRQCDRPQAGRHQRRGGAAGQAGGAGEPAGERPVGGGEQRRDHGLGRDRVELHRGLPEHGGHQPVRPHQDVFCLPAVDPRIQRPDGLHVEHLCLLQLPEHGSVQRVQEGPGGLRGLPPGGDGQLRRQGQHHPAGEFRPSHRHPEDEDERGHLGEVGRRAQAALQPAVRRRGQRVLRRHVPERLQERRHGGRRHGARRHRGSAQTPLPAGLRRRHLLLPALPVPAQRPHRRRVLLQLHVRQKRGNALRQVGWGGRFCPFIDISWVSLF